jgi:peptide/nickel transport system substrate-binding protein
VCIRGGGPGGDFVQEIGNYGGKIVTAEAIGMGSWEFVLMLSGDCTQTIPNICKAWEYSEDGTSFTLHLRQGMKWSDGQVLTADDFVFWWEDMILNEELTPTVPSEWKPGGKVAKVARLDDFAVEYSFAEPFYYVEHLWNSVWGKGMAGGGSGGSLLPKHYMKEYHIDYNPDADALAKEAEFDHWYELFASKAIGRHECPPGVPRLGAWMRTAVSEISASYDRNPYYFRVDPEGNQLPYIDRGEQISWEDNEAHLMQMISGQNQYEAWGVAIADWPVLKQNEEKGGFDLWMGGDLWNAACCYHCNQTYDQDTELRDIFRDKRFRQALSLAIDRDEINERIALGEGTPTQVTCHPLCSWYKDEWGKAYIEFDTNAANALLDDMGLDKRDDEGFRLKPSGEELTIIIETTTAIPYWVPVSEMVKSYWDDVGVRTELKPEDWGLMATRLGANEIQVWCFVMDTVHPFVLLSNKAKHMTMSGWAPKWNQWLNTDGEEGEEPPEDIKSLWDLCEQVPITPSYEIDPIMEELYDLQAENIYTIGTIGYIGKPVVSSKGLGNVDKKAYGDNSSVGMCSNNWMQLVYWKE